MPHELTRRTLVGAAGTSLALLAMPQVARAETATEKQAEADSVRNQLIGLQADLEAAEQKYYGALDARDQAQQAMDAAQVQIDQTNANIADVQGHLASRATTMYRDGSSTFLDVLLGSTSFSEFTQNWALLTKINANDTDLVNEARTLRETLQASKDELARQRQIAADQTAQAQQIKEQTEAKIAEANDLVASLDDEARALLEQEQAAAAAAQAAQMEAQATATQTAEANTQQNTSPSDPAPNDSAPVQNAGGGAVADIPSYGSVVDYALSRIGCPYEWGAEGPDSFDCSGLVTWCYRQIGVYVPHQSEAQKAAARQIVSVAEARPGDVLWRYGHVGIAVGYGGVPYVHAPNDGLLVRDTDPLSWAEFTAALRF